jgi:hypothetical protein
MRSLPRCAFALALLSVAVPASATASPASDGPQTSTPVASRAAGERDERDRMARLRGLGLENLAVADSDSSACAIYENRRYRHSAQALGLAQRALGGRVSAYEKRLAMTAAAITRVEEPGPIRVSLDLPDDAPSLTSGTLRTVEAPGQTGFRVRYPCDAGFPAAPRRPIERPTWRSLDLQLGVLFDYELGRLFDPLLYRLQLEPMLRYNPWPGALARAAVVIPVRSRFGPDPLIPDADMVRPGPLAIEQFAWIPGTGLLSLDGGYFGDNRYGGSAGLARPLYGGRFLLDAQADLTGFIAFGPNGPQYSDPRHWTGFGALTWRPGLDVSVRARVARFLYGDEGVELEVRRAFGDTEIAFFGQQMRDNDAVGVRLVLPVPPMTRATGAPLRIQPVERFGLDYHGRSSLLGRDLAGVASRSDYLRQLDEPALDANRSRFDRATGNPAPTIPGRAPGHDRPPDLINLTGMTGFVNTPWAGVLTDRRLEAGYSHVPRRWAYDHRGANDNEVYYVTLGFLPHTEASVRWTVLPGLRSFEQEVPDSRLTDTDYMASGRLCLAAPDWNRPGVALGIEDARGTRRFHSTYAVTGMPWRIQSVHGRMSVGYAFAAFKAGRRTLLGTFGAFEFSPWRWLAAQLEYDTEKWNLGLAVPAPYGIRFRAAWLHLQTLSAGVGWGFPL